MSSTQYEEDFDEDFRIEELPDTDEEGEGEEDNELENASVLDAPYCIESEPLGQPSSTAGVSGPAAAGTVGTSAQEVQDAGTVEQAPRKRRCVHSADAATTQQQQQLSTNLAAAAAHGSPASKRVRLITVPQPVLAHAAGPSQHRAPAAPAAGAVGTAADCGDAAAAYAVGTSNLRSPNTRSQQRKQKLQNQQQEQQQQQEGEGQKALMSPPPPRQARQRPQRQQQPPAAQQQQLTPHKHGTRAAHAAARAAAAAGTMPPVASPSLSALSGLAAASSTAAASGVGDTAGGEEDSEAICLRTRSKHPLAQEDFDPDMFDRLLAEFDPDVEPLLDEEMYQQFLQSLQGDASYGAIIDSAPDLAAVMGQTTGHAHAAAEPPPPAAVLDVAPQPAPPAAAAAPPGAAAADHGIPDGDLLQGNLQQQSQQQLGQQPLPAGYLTAFNVDDDDDEEFQLDPLDWLVDDEADAAEEEALARLVDPAAEALRDMGRQNAPAPATTAAATAALATCRRRTQREAARRAAERIAAKQQQWVQAQQQQGQLPAAAAAAGGAAAAAVLLPQQQQPLPPLIPATAAGDLQHQQQQEQGWEQAPPQQQAALQHAAHLQQQLPQQVRDSIQQLTQQQQPWPEAGTGGWGSSLHPPGQDQHQPLDAAHAAALPVPPGVLTIRAEQLQQLYQQVCCHTQLLTQLYVLTALDPSPAAQAMASSAGQMLQQIKHLHALSSGSVRGKQLGQLVQHAFEPQQGCGSSDGSGGGNGAAGGARQYSTAAGAGMAGVRQHRLWRPPIYNMQTIWDTAPLRQLDQVVHTLQMTPPPEESVVQTLLERAEGEAATRSKAGRPRRQGARTTPVSQVEQQLAKRISSVLGPCKQSYDSAAWPLIAAASRKTWTTAEDSLLWLGVVRFTGALTPFDEVSACISAQLLPPRPAPTIKKRFNNLIYRRDPVAEMVLSHVLMEGEGPASWAAAQHAAPGGSTVPAASAAADSATASVFERERSLSVSGSVEGFTDMMDTEAAEAPRLPGQRRKRGSGSVSRWKAERSRGPLWAASELGAALTAAFAVDEFGSSLPSTAAAAAVNALLGNSSGADTQPASAAAGGDGEDGVEGFAAPPAALAAGMQLVADLVSDASSKLPVVLPCAIEVPSAASLRRRALALTAREAGQQMLMSLAARQILQAPAGTDTSQDQGQPDAAAAAAVAASAAALGVDPGLLGVQLQQQTVPEQQQQQPHALGSFTAMMQVDAPPQSEAECAATAAAGLATAAAAVAATGSNGMQQSGAAVAQQPQQVQVQSEGLGQPVLVPVMTAAAHPGGPSEPYDAATGDLDAALDQYLAQHVQQQQQQEQGHTRDCPATVFPSAAAEAAAVQGKHQVEHPAQPQQPQRQQSQRQHGPTDANQQQAGVQPEAAAAQPDAHDAVPQQQSSAPKKWWQLPKQPAGQHKKQPDHASAPAAPDHAANRANSPKATSLHRKGRPAAAAARSERAPQQQQVLGARAQQLAANATGLQQLRPRATTAAQLAEQLRSASRQHEAQAKAEHARQKRLRREASKQQSSSAKSSKRVEEQQDHDNAADVAELQGATALRPSDKQQSVGDEQDDEEETCSESELQTLAFRLQNLKTVRRPRRRAAPRGINSNDSSVDEAQAAAAGAAAPTKASDSGPSDAAALPVAAAAAPTGPTAGVHGGRVPAASAAGVFSTVAGAGDVVDHTAPEPQQLIPATGQSTEPQLPAAQPDAQAGAAADTESSQQPQQQQVRTETITQQPELQHGQQHQAPERQQFVPVLQQQAASTALGRRSRPSTALRTVGPASSTVLRVRGLAVSSPGPRPVGSSPPGKQQPPAGAPDLGDTGGHDVPAGRQRAFLTAAGSVSVSGLPPGAADAGGISQAGVRLIGLSSAVPSTKQVRHRAGSTAAPPAASAGAWLFGAQGLRPAPTATLAGPAPPAAGTASQCKLRVPGRSLLKPASRSVGSTPAGMQGFLSAAAATAAAAAAGATPSRTPRALQLQPPAAYATTRQHQEVQQQWQQQLMWQRLQLWHQRQQQPDPAAAAGTIAAAAATPAVTPSGGWLVEVTSSEKTDKLRRSLFGRKTAAQPPGGTTARSGGDGSVVLQGAAGARGLSAHTGQQHVVQPHSQQYTAGAAAAAAAAAGGTAGPSWQGGSAQQQPAAGNMPQHCRADAAGTAAGQNVRSPQGPPRTTRRTGLSAPTQQQQVSSHPGQDQHNVPSSPHLSAQPAAGDVATGTTYNRHSLQQHNDQQQRVHNRVNLQEKAAGAGQAAPVLQQAGVRADSAPAGGNAAGHGFEGLQASAAPVASPDSSDQQLLPGQQQHQRSQSKLAAAVMNLGRQRSAERQLLNPRARQRVELHQDAQGMKQQQVRRSARQQEQGAAAPAVGSPHPGLDVLASAAAAEAEGRANE